MRPHGTGFAIALAFGLLLWALVWWWPIVIACALTAIPFAIAVEMGIDFFKARKRGRTHA